MAAVCLLSVQTVPGFFAQPLPGLEVREFGQNLGVCGLLTRSLQDGRAVAALNRAGEGPWGLQARLWDLPRHLLLEDLLGVALALRLCWAFGLRVVDVYLLPLD